MKRLISFIFLILITCELFSSIINTENITTTGSTKPYSSSGSLGRGSFGFELRIESETHFWISTVSNFDEEISSFTLVNTDASQEIAFLILQTKESHTYKFDISKDKLYLEDDITKSNYIDYTLEFNDGVNSYEVNNSLTYRYSKGEVGNIKKSIGSFQVKIPSNADGSMGSYKDTISVGITIED